MPEILGKGYHEVRPPYHKGDIKRGENTREKRAEALPQSGGDALPPTGPNECAPRHLESRREAAGEFSSQKRACRGKERGSGHRCLQQENTRGRPPKPVRGGTTHEETATHLGPIHYRPITALGSRPVFALRPMKRAPHCPGPGRCNGFAHKAKATDTVQRLHTSASGAVTSSSHLRHAVVTHVTTPLHTGWHWH